MTYTTHNDLIVFIKINAVCDIRARYEENIRKMTNCCRLVDRVSRRLESLRRLKCGDSYLKTLAKIENLGTSNRANAPEPL